MKIKLGITLLFCLFVKSNSMPTLSVDEDCSDGLPNYRNYPYDCQKYYGCSEEKILVVYSCEDGLFWNAEVKACDIKTTVICATTSQSTTESSPLTTSTIPTSTTTTTTPKSTITTTAPTPTSTITSSTPAPRSTITTTTPTPTSTITSSTPAPTSTITTTTSTTTSTTTRRPTSSVPTSTSSSTISSTMPSSKPTETTTSSITTTKTTQSPVPTPPLCGWKTEYFPYPYSCSKYYECHDYDLLLRECDADLLWNNELKRCDHTWNVDCSYTIPYPTSPTTPSPMVCSAENNFFVYPDDCTKYYECINDTPVLKECPEAMGWDRNRDVCVFIGDVNCSNI